MPFDGLTFERAAQLVRLAELIEEARDVRLKLYLVASDTGYENLFYVREFKQVSAVMGTMYPSGTLALGLGLRDSDSTISKQLKT